MLNKTQNYVFLAIVGGGLHSLPSSQKSPYELDIKLTKEYRLCS